MIRTHDMVLFDLDGTLSDPIVGIGNSINYALHSYGFEPLSLEKVAEYVGPPIDQTFRSITGITADRQIHKLVGKYRQRYADVGYSENTLYPGIPDALKLFSDANISMAVCTSKRVDFAEKILTMFGLRVHFEFINGGDVGVHKWQQIADLRKERLVSGATVMVGDRAIDIVAAHRNGLKAAGVLWGYGSNNELTSERPEYLFLSPSNLARLLD